MKLDGKIALVTGASRGIGRAIALRLAKDGAMVCVHYVSDRAGAEATAGSITAAGGSAFILQADMGVMDDVRRLVDELKAELVKRTGADRLDILVNNAGIAINVVPEEFTEEQFDRQIQVNLKGPLMLAKYLMYNINDGGRIINISSQQSQRVTSQFFLYGSAKAALDNLTRGLARSFGKRGITVNSVAPGATNTDMMGNFDEQLKAQMAQTIALGRLGDPEDVADVVAFIASDDARWVTGEYLSASGGAVL